MTIITKKVRLIPAPFVGTRIRIKLDDPEALRFGISNLFVAEGREKATLDWGDGTQEVITTQNHIYHIYPQPGEYLVKVSDDIDSMRLFGADSSEFATFAPLIRELVTNATVLATLNSRCFNGARNLTIFDCKMSGVSYLASYAFGNCTSLVGRLDFPKVDSLAAAVFSGCSKITELHFAKANETAIKDLEEWKESGGNFGAENATVFFDL